MLEYFWYYSCLNNVVIEKIFAIFKFVTNWISLDKFLLKLQCLLMIFDDQLSTLFLYLIKELLGMASNLCAISSTYKGLNLLPILTTDSQRYKKKIIFGQNLLHKNLDKYDLPARNNSCSFLVHLPRLIWLFLEEEAYPYWFTAS